MTYFAYDGTNRRFLLGALAALPTLFGTTTAQAQTTPLASWNDGPAKQALTQPLMDEAKARMWTVVSKNDWKRNFAFET
jgi:hypothetical protein